MYGRYTSDLSQYAKVEAKRLKLLERKRRRDEKRRKKEYRDQNRSRHLKLLSKGVSFVWQKTFARLGEDWVFLAILGILMAIISFIVDWGIGVCNRGNSFLHMSKTKFWRHESNTLFNNILFLFFVAARIWLFLDMNYHIALQYFAWIILPICLVLFSAGFVHVIAPQAIGKSGCVFTVFGLTGSYVFVNVYNFYN